MKVKDIYPDAPEKTLDLEVIVNEILFAFWRGTYLLPQPMWPTETRGYIDLAIKKPEEAELQIKMPASDAQSIKVAIDAHGWNFEVDEEEFIYKLPNPLFDKTAYDFWNESILRLDALKQWAITRSLYKESTTERIISNYYDQPSPFATIAQWE
jgi:hypothetical protein